MGFGAYSLGLVGSYRGGRVLGLQMQEVSVSQAEFRVHSSVRFGKGCTDQARVEHHGLDASMVAVLILSIFVCLRIEPQYI